MEVPGFEAWASQISASLDGVEATAAAEYGHAIAAMLRRERRSRAPASSPVTMAASTSTTEGSWMGTAISCNCCRKGEP